MCARWPASATGSSSAHYFGSRLRRDAHQLVECQAARATAAAGLALDAEPDHRAAPAPARALVGMGHLGSLARHLLLVHEVGLWVLQVEPLAQQDRPRLDLGELRRSALDDPRQPGSLE